MVVPTNHLIRIGEPDMTAPDKVARRKLSRLIRTVALHFIFAHSFERAR